MRGMVHLKTAGTSFLEALRLVALQDPDLFREILEFSSRHYEENRVGFPVSAEAERIPSLEQLSDAQLPQLLDQFDTRQVLHVAFGSVVDNYEKRFYEVLSANELIYAEHIERLFKRHLQPFVLSKNEK